MADEPRYFLSLVNGHLRVFDMENNEISTDQAQNIIGELMNSYPTTGYIYLAEKTEDDFVIYKIGMTGQTPSARISQIRFDEGDPEISLLHFVRCESIQEARQWERWLHKLFHLNNVRGEWFDLADRDVEWLCQFSNPPFDGAEHSDFIHPKQLGILPWSFSQRVNRHIVFDAEGNRIAKVVNEHIASMIVQSANLMSSEHMQTLARIIGFAEYGEMSSGLNIETENLRDWLREIQPELNRLEDWPEE